MTYLMKHWESRWIGRPVLVHCFATPGATLDGGTLCGYETDGDGLIVRLLVAFSPNDRRWFPVDQVVTT